MSFNKVRLYFLQADQQTQKCYKIKISLQNQFLFRIVGHHRGYAGNFSCCRGVFYNSGKKKKLYKRKIPFDDIASELKNFSYIKAFFNNIVSSAEIKATSEVTKNVVVSIINYKRTCPFICSRYCIEKKNLNKKTPAKSKALLSGIQSAVKGSKMSINNETL